VRDLSQNRIAQRVLAIYHEAVAPMPRDT
jgi:hypothetical protein